MGDDARAARIEAVDRSEVHDPVRIIKSFDVGAVVCQ
jgi:hypothetical protein